MIKDYDFSQFKTIGKCEECQKPTVEADDKLCHNCCYHKVCDACDCWCSICDD